MPSVVSIWENDTFFAPQDVIVAGSGFVGLWSAFWLKKKNPGYRISIVERGVIPAGASTRNAGFACFGSLGELVHDARTMGESKMLQLVEMRYKGLERIRKTFSNKTIDYEPCGGFELYDAGDQTSVQQLIENIQALNSMLKPITGEKHTFRLIDEKIPDFGFGQTKHMVKNSLEGSLHPGKLLQALLHCVQAMGVQIFTATDIKGFERINDRVEVNTGQPFTLTTRQLLICTNAFARELLPQLDVVPARGQVLLTSPVEGLPWKGTFHSDEGFYYFRNLGNKVLLGGARNKAFEEEQTTQLQVTAFIQKELEDYLDHVILPLQKGRYTIEQRWSGIMAMGSEKIPIVQQVAPSVYCAVRMSGMGVALAPVAGRQVAEMMKEGL